HTRCLSDWSSDVCSSDLRAGAAFVNAEMMLAGGKWDTFRMLTHPGTAIIPAGLVAAELEGAPGKEYITGIAAAYEVMERLAAERSEERRVGKEGRGGGGR